LKGPGRGRKNEKKIEREGRRFSNKAIVSVTTVCGGIRFLRVAFFTWITSLEKITFIFIFYVFMNKL